MFRINEVLTHEGTLFRVLSLLGEQIVWINIEDSRGLPSLVFVSELSKAFDDEMLIRADDPYAKLILATPEEGSTAQLKRDKNFRLIRDIISDPLFYDPQVRGAKIKEVASANSASKSNLYKLIRRYWQRGQTPNALLPHYKNSGGKGKKRKANGKKFGRPRTISPGVGATIDEQTERLFRIAIDKHLLTENKSDFPYAHRRFTTLYKNYFPDTSESEIPTKWQMLHFYKREYSLTEKLRKRTNKIEYNKDVRQLSSTANAKTLGPGSRYEIDATIADIYLVSDSDRGNIVGRPVIYFVKDVFSRMIAGFYVG
ncbi:MAG: transposase, partial [Proteobacteria bacterium]|nr:transposase [Pseudomonadota bacterium]